MPNDNSGEMPVYKLGDVIRIEIEFSDASGVQLISAQFDLSTDVTRSIFISTELDGPSSGTALLEKEVTEGIVPGVYECAYVALRDVKGNRTHISKPPYRFRVEEYSGDYEGPKLKMWRWA